MTIVMTVFYEGYSAYMHDEPLNSNPYKSGTVGFQEWRNGWLKANSDYGSYVPFHES